MTLFGKTSSITRTWVKKFLSADPASQLRSDPVRYSRRLALTSLTLGRELYQQERNPAEIRESLALAAKSMLAVLALPEDRAVLAPLEFEEALALAVCFCPPSVYQNIDQIPMKKFLVDPADEFFAILAQYLSLRVSVVTIPVIERAQKFNRSWPWNERVPVLVVIPPKGVGFAPAAWLIFRFGAPGTG